MSEKHISLQNTPERKGTVSRPVSFFSNGATLQGMLFTPEESEAPLPAVIVTGAWTTVKEQMPGTYARELAARGFAALAFDFSGWGESEGSPRYVEDPAVKTRDIIAATNFLTSLEEIDHKRIHGLGICASSGYMADVASLSSDLQRVALVAPWLHDQQIAAASYGGEDSVAGLIAASEADTAAGTTLLAASASDENSVMYQAPYYTEQDRGLIPEYDNKFSALSWKPWLTYNGLASAKRLNKPLLFVGSASIALPAGVEAYENRTSAPIEKVWLGDDVTQFDFYDRKDVVAASADAVAEFFTA